MESIERIITQIDIFRDKSKLRILKIWYGDNIVLLVDYAGEKFIVKDSIRGWGFYEYIYMKILRLEGYPVPQPINFYPLSKASNTEWAYGYLPRYRGILVYKYIKGFPLCDEVEEWRVVKAVDLMRRLHNDKRHQRSRAFIPDYEKIESARLKYYMRKVNLPSDLKERLNELSRNYLREKIDYVLIHGDFRPHNLIISNSDEVYMIDLEGISDGADKYKDAGVFSAECQRLGFFEIEDILKKQGYDTESVRYVFYLARRILVLLRHERDIKRKKMMMNILQEKLRDALQR